MYKSNRERAMMMKISSKYSGIPSAWLTVIAGVFCLACSAGAAAGESRPCADDAARLCKGVQAGEGRVARCLKEHEKELSPACKENIAKAKEKIRDFAEACKDDMQKNCKDVKPGGGRILQCLKQHEATLSPDCKEHMSQPRGKQ
jgi:hypothetical protein